MRVMEKQLWRAPARSHSAGSPTIVNTKGREVSVVRDIEVGQRVGQLTRANRYYRLAAPFFRAGAFFFSREGIYACREGIYALIRVDRWEEKD